jgi:hypothetical protein
MEKSGLVKYLPCRCRLLNQPVWAILTRQSGGGWRIINCLDKDRPCFDQPCAFTTDGGEWPLDVAPTPSGNA